MEVPKNAYLELQNGFNLNRGNDGSNFWFFYWLPGGSLNDKVDFIHIHDSDLCVCDFMQVGEWRLFLLSNFWRV